MEVGFESAINLTGGEQYHEIPFLYILCNLKDFFKTVLGSLRRMVSGRSYALQSVCCTHCGVRHSGTDYERNEGRTLLSFSM